MTNHYIFQWSDYALNELQKAFDYILTNFGDNTAVKLSLALQNTLDNIQQNPEIYPIYHTPFSHFTIRKVTILRYNTLYYAVDEANKIVKIYLFFSNRQNPQRINELFNQVIK